LNPVADEPAVLPKDADESFEVVETDEPLLSAGTVSALPFSVGTNSSSWSPTIYLIVLTQISASSSSSGGVILIEPLASSPSPTTIPGLVNSADFPGPASLQLIPSSAGTCPSKHSQVSEFS